MIGEATGERYFFVNLWSYLDKGRFLGWNVNCFGGYSYDFYTKVDWVRSYVLMVSNEWVLSFFVFLYNSFFIDGRCCISLLLLLLVTTDYNVF